MACDYSAIIQLVISQDCYMKQPCIFYMDAYSYVFVLFIFCRFFLYVLVTGQLTSLALTGLNVFATLFSNHTGKDISTTLSAGAYFILGVTVGPCVAYQPGFVDKLKQYW